MKRISALVTVFASIAVASASAQVFTATYTPYQGFSDSASLTMFGTSAGSGVYDISHISGTVDGVAVNSPVIGYAGADNQLFVPANSTFVDFAGISFGDMSGNTWNLYSDTGYAVPGSYGLMSNANNQNPVGYPVSWGYPGSEGTLTVAQSVPEPGQLLALGAGVLGLALRRRRK